MQTMIGRYRLEGEVARGGMGAVFRALAPDGRTVALKLLLAGRQALPAQRQRMRREAEALLRLDHPGVVPILDAGEEGQVPYLVLEWVEGQDLGSWLEQERTLDPVEAAGLVARLARALEHCHGRGVLHRDLKPGNVLLRARDGAPLLTDFGLAAALDLEQAELTRTGQFLGSPGYWPPEQALGERERIGVPSDVWGLGAILFALLTGRPPLDNSSLVGAIQALEGGVPPVSRLRADVPAALDAVCARCLAREPGDRYPDARGVAEALEGWLESGAPADRPGPFGLRRVALVLVLLLGLGLGLGFGLRPGSSPAEPGPAPPAPPDPARAAAVAAAIEEAARARRDSRIADALGALDGALELDPASAPARVARARLRRCSGDLRGAQADLDQVLAADPACVPALIERGYLAVREADWALAGQCAERALAGSPEHATALALQGTVIGNAGDEAAAAALSERALAADPDDLEAQFLRGLLLERRGDLAAAADYYQRIKAEEPQNPRFLTRHACTVSSRSGMGAAVRELDRALELDPGIQDARINRGEFRRFLGDLEGARADCERLLRDDPDSAGALRLRAQLRRGAGDREGAYADLLRAVELEPRNASAVYYLIHALRERGEPERALPYADQMVTMEPLRADIWLLRGELRQALDDPGARLDLERFLELAPADHPRRASVLAGLEQR